MSSGSRIRIAVVADVRFYREALAEVLGHQDEIEVVATAARMDAFDLVQAVDVVVLDVSAPGALGAVQTLAAGREPVRTVGIALTDVEQQVLACAEAGVSGYVSRNGSLEEVVTAIRLAARGETLCSPWVAATVLRRLVTLSADRMAASNGASKLTHREAEIMELLGQGCSNKEIARRLCIEMPTVKNHVHHILEKLNVGRRGEAVALLSGTYAAEAKPKQI
jgi:two-component system, NarL family, nitrate/nitrite response regulator NarL